MNTIVRASMRLSALMFAAMVWLIAGVPDTTRPMQTVLHLFTVLVLIRAFRSRS